MEKFDNWDLDVKTMRLAAEITATGSLSLAAARIGLSQSTASYRLDKLRGFAGDPVFVRAAGSMSATPRGAAIVDAFAEVLARIEALAIAPVFDPAAARRDFTIAAAAPETAAVLPALFRRLAAAAPECRLIAEALRTGDLPRDLDDAWDIALMTRPPSVASLKKSLLFEDRLVTFYDPSQRSAPATLDAFCRADHGVATLGGGPKSPVDRALAQIGRSREVKLWVSAIEALAPLMRGTTLITTLPASLADHLMRDFSFVPCPAPIDPLPFNMVWHERKDADPALRWLRAEIREATRPLRRG